MRFEEELRDGSGSTSPRLVFFPSQCPAGTRSDLTRMLGVGALVDRVLSVGQPVGWLYDPRTLLESLKVHRDFRWTSSTRI